MAPKLGALWGNMEFPPFAHPPFLQSRNISTLPCLFIRLRRDCLGSFRIFRGHEVFFYAPCKELQRATSQSCFRNPTKMAANGNA